MSSRALRRLQKDQIPDIVNADKSDQESEEEDYVEQKKPAFNPFDLLNEGNDDAEEEEEEEEEYVEEKKPEPVIEKPSSNSNSKKNKKKQKKKNNKKSNDNTHSEDISMRELDKVLKDLGQKSSSKSSKKNTANTEERRQLLSVNYRFLDAEAEMKRLFGSHVVNSENRASQGRVLKKSKFATPKSDWPPYKRNGLSMEVTETKEGITYYAFRHSEQYQDVQLEFLNAIATHNPEALLFLIRRHPYHVDSLLQLSEIAKHSGDWTSAGDFIERALYACERALHPQFSLNTGTARLSYTRSENRSFFLAVFRHIQFLTRRGCWKTAFEFNKLLFSLDPVSDPLSALLSLDYHALSSKDYDYVVRMQADWKTDGELYPVEMNNMPNFAYSAAYAKFKMSEKIKNVLDVDEGSRLLKEAIKKYPLVYCRLLEKLGEPEPEQLVQLTQYIPNEYMEIMQLSYIERTYEMWKEPEVLEWLKANGSQVLDYIVQNPGVIQRKLLCQAKDQVPLSLCRYIVLIDIQKLMSYLPSSITNQSYQMYDPLPPADSTTQYDINERMRQTGGGRSRSSDIGNMMNVLRNLLGGAENRGINPENQQQIRQLMAELEQVRRQNAVQAPGAFPGAEDTIDDEIDAALEHHEQEYTEDYPDLMQNENEDEPAHRDVYRPNHGVTAEELMEIMNAIGDEEEDLEIQRALAEEFRRNQE